MKDMLLDDACQSLIHEAAFDKDQMDSVARDISLLKQRGMLTVPVYELSEAEIDRQLEQRYARPNPKLMLALAETCNLACKYCYNSTSMDAPSNKNMPQEIARKSVDWLFNAVEARQDIAITFFGGEPLLNKSLFHWVIEYSQALAAKFGKTVCYSMTTNATLLDDGVIEQIKKHNFGLMISMDGPAEVHNAQRPTLGGRPSFAKAADGVKRLMRRRKQVTVRCTLTNLRPRLLSLVKFFEEFGFTRILLGKVTNSVSSSPVDCTKEDREEYARQEEEELIPYMFKHLSKGKMPCHFPYAEFIRKQAGRDGKPVRPSLANCGAANGMTIVGADGNLYPCHRYLGMKNWVVGRIAEGWPVTEMLKRYWKDFEAAVSPKCGTCWARLLCNRPCAWEVSSGEWRFGHVPDWDCDLRRKYFETAASVMFRVKTEYPEIYERIVSKSGTSQRFRTTRSVAERAAVSQRVD